MAPGITKKSELFELLRENLALELNFDENEKELVIKLSFKGYTEPIVTETVGLGHYHDRRDLDIPA